MLRINTEFRPERRGLQRRDFLQVGALSALGLTLPDLLQAREQAGTGRTTRARACIMLWMGGGPSHIDTFDPKPDAASDYRGPFRSIPTGVTGMRLSEHLPRMAAQANKFSILRSMTHPSPSHEIANHIMLTGNVPARGTVNPSYGSVVFQDRGFGGEIPPYVAVPNAPMYAESGFLGGAYKPFPVGNDPNAADFRVRGLTLPRHLNAERLDQRRQILGGLDTFNRELENEEQFNVLDSFYRRSYEMITGPAVQRAFDLQREAAPLRDRYGRNTLGQSCLLARRLVEAGVPFIHVDRGGWDTHLRNFETLSVNRLPELDQAFSALLEDLDTRGLLDTTMVIWMGEFGRTPKIDWSAQWQGGRHHWSRCFSVVVAGGGFRGGQVVGSSDAVGEAPKDRPVLPWDLGATMLGQLGIPFDKNFEIRGRNMRLLPFGTSVVSGGMLTEIL